MIYIFIILTFFIFLLFYNYTIKEGMDITGVNDTIMWNDCDKSVLGDLSSQLGDEICGGLRDDTNKVIRAAAGQYNTSDISM